MKPRSIVLMATALLAGCDHPVGLLVENARVRALVPGRDATAAYFDITNNTHSDVVVDGASADGARAVEIHVTYVKGDGLAMRRLDEVVVPRGATVSFAPQGMHLMLFGVPEVSDPFPITLTTTNGERIEVAFSKLAL